MENKLVPREGFRLETVKISNYQRKLTPAAVWHNLVTVQRMAATFSKTKRILKEFQPDVIVGTGGYASFPALKMGAKLGIPTCVHESNAGSGPDDKACCAYGQPCYGVFRVQPGALPGTPKRSS